MLWILVLGLLLPGHFSALTPCLRRTNLPFLRFLRKFSVPLPASSVLLLRLLGVEVVFLPLQSSVSSPPLCRRSWGLVVAPLLCVLCGEDVLGFAFQITRLQITNYNFPVSSSPSALFHWSTGTQSSSLAFLHASMVVFLQTSKPYTGCISHTDCRAGEARLDPRHGVWLLSKNSWPRTRIGCFPAPFTVLSVQPLGR